MSARKTNHDATPKSAKSTESLLVAIGLPVKDIAQLHDDFPCGTATSPLFSSFKTSDSLLRIFLAGLAANLLIEDAGIVIVRACLTQLPRF
jgi:hypothetical protein